MALGKKGGNSNLTLYILKIKTKDSTGQQVDPYFSISAKEDGKWVVTDKTVDSVSGKIYKVETRVGEFDGEPILSSQVYLKDGEEAYLLDLKYTIISRGIVNSILNIKDFNKEVEVSLYTNKKGYAAASVRSGGQLVDWKFSLDELPEPTKVKFKGKEMRDFTEVDNFFQAEVKALGERLTSGEEVEDSGGGAVREVKEVVETPATGGDEEEEPLF